MMSKILIFSKTDRLWMYRCLESLPSVIEDDKFKFYLKSPSQSIRSKWAPAVKNILLSKTHKRSIFRKIPNDILHKILEYSLPQNTYFVKNMTIDQ